MAAMRRAASFPTPKILPRNNPEGGCAAAHEQPAARPPRSGWSYCSPLQTPGEAGCAAAAAPSPPGRRARSPLAGAARFRGSLLVPPACQPGASSFGEGLPMWGDPPDPPFEEGAALNGRPEGGRRAPRPGAGPPKFAARETGRCWPGARCCPCCFSGPGLVQIVRAPRARPAPRARGGRWLSPGRGPRRPRRGGRERPFALGRGNGGKRPAGRSPAADAAPAQRAGAPFLAGEAAPFRKLVHFLVKFACPPPPM